VRQLSGLPVLEQLKYSSGKLSPAAPYNFPQKNLRVKLRRTKTAFSSSKTRDRGGSISISFPGGYAVLCVAQIKTDRESTRIFSILIVRGCEENKGLAISGQQLATQFLSRKLTGSENVAFFGEYHVSDVSCASGMLPVFG
jgi:hypothetical protein